MADAQTNSRLPGSAGAALAALAFACFTSAPAAAAPEGEDVVSGEATFTRDGSLTQIDTATPQTIINWWGGFDIGAGETVLFNQPDALSNVLNYDPSSDPSHINGSLFSNGGVWIINPVGVFFGDQAIVDVGRLVAGAGKVDPEEFRVGVERWSELTGRVEVGAGAQIRAADSVLLVGAAVANYGNISAADGMIALIAGGEVRLARVDGRVIVTADRALAPDPERWAVVQAGTLDAGRGNVSLTAGDAYSLAINHTGITRARDILAAGGEKGIVSVSGTLDASDRSAGATGGAIAVTGDRVALLGAQLDASGDAGGGEIRAGGNLRGEGELPTAQRIYVDENSSLRADAISTGDGGTIIVWSDEATRFYGALSARGGALGGDGGFAEISGASLASRGSIDLGASAGSAGTLLYDPKDILIVGGAAPVDGSDDPDTAPDQLVGSSAGQVLFGTPDELLSPFTIHESEIEGTDANVILEATNSIYTENSGAFVGAVTLRPDRSLTMLTRNNAGDEGITPGIQLAGVSFQTSGTGSIALATGNDGAGAGGSSPTAASIAVGNLGTAGGAVSVATKKGAISAGNVTTSASVAGSGAGNVTLTTGDGGISVGAITAFGAGGSAGGNGGAVVITAGGTGSVTAGAIDAHGGSGAAGAGGDGGDVGIRTIEGGITVAAINVSAGNGAGGGRGGNGGTIKLFADLDAEPATPPDPISRVITVNGDLKANGGTGSDAGAIGGTGGSIELSAGLFADDGSIVLGAIDASGGSGTAGGGSAYTPAPNDSLAAPDAIRIEAHGDITANGNIVASGGDTTSGGPGGVGGNGGEISITSAAGNVTTGGLVSEGGNQETPATDDDGTHGTAIVEGHGNITVALGALDRFELIETEETGTVDVQRDNGTQIALGSGIGGLHTITQLQTGDTDPHFTYRLADGGDGPVDQVDINTLAVASNAVTVGASGVKLANARADAAQLEGERLLGKIQGSAGGTHVNATGNLELFATNIGDATPLEVLGGAATSLEVTVEGDIGQTDAADLPAVAGLVVSGAGRVDLVQRSASGDVAITLPGGDVAIDGTVEDDGASRVETSVVRKVDTSGGSTEFYLHLADISLSGAEAGSEPALQIAGDAVTLGANAGFAAAGDLELARGAIDAGDKKVMLVADANGNDSGAIEGLAEGTDPHVANAGALVAIAGAGVGTVEAPLRTSAASGTNEILIAGSAGSGDFVIENEANDADLGSVVVAPIDLLVANAGTIDAVSFRGVHAAGSVELRNGGRDIVLRDVQEGAAEEVLRPRAEPSFGIEGTKVGTDLRFGFGDLHAPVLDFVAADPAVAAPHVQSGGSQRYAGSLVLASDVELVAGGTTTFGGNVGGIGAFKVTDALFEGDRAVTVASGDFQRVDGTGSLALNAAETLVFHEDIGVAGDLRANAGLLSFTESADRIAARSVALNTTPPPSTPDRFQYATIADTFGGLTIESADTVTMGAGEKLSSAGPLVIRAGSTATLGDLAATELIVEASEIFIQRRAPGSVALQNGAVVPDNGVDWVANNITTNVVPGSTGADPAAPTFVLGSGGIRTGGVVPFDVFRFTQRGDAVRAASFAGQGGRTLDLTGLGPRAVSDASSDVPRPAPPVLPGLAARPGDEPPSPPREISSDELIGALHCRTAAGDSCAPPAVSDDPLASERALEIRQRYRALLAGEEAQQNLRAAFAPLARVPVGDVDALSRSLAHDPALGAARARIADLAVALAQVELLGLDESESERARRAIAADFAAATGVAGLRADAVLAAVDASGVAVLP